MAEKVIKEVSAVRVRNLQRQIPVNVNTLEQFAQRALQACGRFRRAGHADILPDEIFFLLISDRRMASLHQQFLNEPGPTDVITFQHGEIFISVPTARRQARQFGTSLVRELQLYIVHGLLHLHGFKDQTQRETRQMRAAEAAVLSRSIV
jgi:rRNA maturation RNase YbeY